MTTIITKNSSTASSVPSAAQLVQGELAVNVTDRRLFTENSSGTVVELGTNPSSLTLPNGTANGVAYLNGSKALTTGSALTFDGSLFSVVGSSVLAAATGTGQYTSAYLYSTGTTARAASFKKNYDSPYDFVITSAETTATNADIVFKTNQSSERMRLTSTGLGIGTSSPGRRLAIEQSAGSATGIVTSNPSVSANAVAVVEAQADAASGFLAAVGSATTATTWGGRASTVVLSTSSAGSTGGIAVMARNAAGIITMHTGGDTERMRIDSSGNLGLGVTPSAWRSTDKALQIGAQGSIAITSTHRYQFGVNTYTDSGGTNTYIGTGNATRYDQLNGEHQWRTAPSGTAGTAISFTQAMTLDSLGRLGVGTTNPLARIVASNAGAEGLELSPVAGYISGAYIQAYNRSTSSYMPLEFNATTIAFYNNANERARIDSSGNLLVGTTDSSTNQQGYAWNINSGGSFGRIGHANGTASGTAYLAFQYNGGVIGTITQSGTTAVLYNVTSDQRLKQNIVDAPEFGSVIDSIKVRSYDWKADGNHQRAGFIAQELVTVAPEAVHQPEDPEQMMAVDYSKLVPMLVKEIQSLRKRLAAAGIA